MIELNKNFDFKVRKLDQQEPLSSYQIAIKITIVLPRRWKEHPELSRTNLIIGIRTLPTGQETNIFIKKDAKSTKKKQKSKNEV